MELHEDLYRIGAVARITGVAVERLRAWDRRYGFAPAHRSGKTRFYSRAQLERLTRLKQLIDKGQSISSVVGLSDEQLDRRLTAGHQLAASEPRLGLIGPNLLVLEHQSDTSANVAARWANMDAFVDAPPGAEELDAVAVQLPVLSMHPLEIIEDICPNVRIVALYQFATEKHLGRVREQGVTALRWPLGWPEIEQACSAGGGQPLRAGRAAPRRFTDEQLIEIAANATDPSKSSRHLVELITQLNAFADYTQAWQSADEAPSGGTALHEGIYNQVTEARVQLELALEALATAEELLPASIGH